MSAYPSFKTLLHPGRKFAWVLLAALPLTLAASTPLPIPTNSSDSTTIALPQNTVEGRLDNGLHYLILPNEVPAHTVEMRLVMRIGAVQETEQQKGCAHFLEHMAFAGTQHFPQRSLIDYLESLGMKFGRDINAVTGYDRTVFMLTVPLSTSDHGVLDSTLLVLKDWLSGISFQAKRVKQERGVILEELRTYRNDDRFYDLKIGQSRFKERMPLGSADDIRKVERKELKRFYEKWYAPKFASVIVVGNVNAKEVEQRIERLFGNLPDQSADDFQSYPLTYEAGPQMMEIRDSIKQKSTLEIILPHQGIVGKDHRRLLQKERQRLAAYALDHRLSARRLSCGVTDDWYLSDTHHFVLSFSGTDKEDLLQKITRVSSEWQLLMTTGWEEEEFEQLKQDFAQAITLTTDGKSSATYCDDFTDYVLQGERYLHQADDLKRLREGIKNTSQADLQQLLKKVIGGLQEKLLLAYQNNAGEANGMVAEEVLAAWENGKTIEAPSYRYRHYVPREKRISTPNCLQVKHELQTNTVVSETYLPRTRITDVRLKNGLRLVFRPTPQAEETVLINLLGKGGLAQLSREAYPVFESTAGFMEMGGIAAVPYDTLTQYMAQAGLLLNVSIGAFWHDLLATSPAPRCGELLQLINEKLHQPELCHADFEEVRADELESLGEETLLDQLLQRAPDRLLTNRLDSLVGNAPFAVFGEKSAKDVARMNLDSIAHYFSTLYAQLDETTIVFTGHYDLKQVKALAIATFGAFKAVPPHPAMRPSLPPFKGPQQPYREGFDNDEPTQTVLEYVYPGQYEPSLKNGLVLKLMRDLLQDRLLRVLRERENVVYSPYVSLFYHGFPQHSFYFNLSLSVDTKNSRRTHELVQEIIEELKGEPVTTQELEKLKRAFLVNKSQVLTESAATDWRNTLATLIKNGEELEDFEHYDDVLESITPETVWAAFRHLISSEREILLYRGKHQCFE